MLLTRRDLQAERRFEEMNELQDWSEGEYKIVFELRLF